MDWVLKRNLNAYLDYEQYLIFLWDSRAGKHASTTRVSRVMDYGD